MSKLSFILLSLIGAIPGGLLSVLLIMAMLNHFRDMAGMMKVIVSLILLLSAFLLLVPIGIVLFVKEEKAKDAETEAEEAAETAADGPPTDDDAGRQSGAMEETATKVEMSDDFADEFTAAEEQPEPEPKGRKKKKGK